VTKRLIIFAFIIYALFQNALIQSEIIDELNIISGIGFDYINEDTVEGTVLVPQYVSETKTKNITFNSKGKISWDLISNLHKESQEPLVTGSIEVIGFGYEMAKRGIIEYMDALSRDPSVGEHIYIFISESKASDILKQNYTQRGTGMYLSDIIDHNQRQRDLPATNFHIFLNDYYEVGKDPYLPIINLVHDKSKVEITGIAIFKDGKMKERLNPNELFPFKLMVDKYSEGSYLIKNDDDYVDIRSINSKRKLKVISPDHVIVKIDVTGMIREYTGNMITPKIVKEIEKNFSNDVKKKCEELIQRFQEHQIDPIGIGSAVRSHTRNFQYEKWKENYPNMKISVDVNLKLIEWGIWE
jgi:spore germination protein